MQPKIKYTSGQEESVTFEPLSNTEHCRFFDALVAGDTPALVAICTRRNAKWIDALHPDCFLELLKAFIQENFSMAMRIALANPIAGVKAGPLLQQMGSFMRSLPEEERTEIERLASSSARTMTSAATPASAGPSSSGSPSAPPPAVAAPATPPA